MAIAPRSAGVWSFLTVLLLVHVAGVTAEVRFGDDGRTFTITNPLNLSWPWELVHVDAPDGLTGEVSVLIGDERRPAQLQPAEGDRPARLWFIATLPGGKGAPGSVGGRIVPGRTDSPLRLERAEGLVLVGNGVYEARFPDLNQTFSSPRPLRELAPILGGVRVPGADDGRWYGRARYESDAPVRSVATRIVERGPVYLVIHQRIEIAAPAAEQPPAAPADAAEGDFDAVPAKALDATAMFYDVTVRCVVGDPWIDVSEHHHLPPQPDQIGSVANYQFELGPTDLRPDTVMWVRWFDYGQFGGNIDMHFAQLQRRPGQTGPFVQMRPRWSQQPGGGMDFFLTRTGPSPYYRDRHQEHPLNTLAYDPDAPAVGFIATHPIRWFNPYAHTIAAYAEGAPDHPRGLLRFPLASGRRSYALCAGPRKLFDSTGTLNHLIRRRTDWTLNDQMHRYVLEWQRDPARAGPHILIDRRTLEGLRADLAAGRDTPQTRIVRKYEAQKDRLKGLDRDLLEVIMGRPVGTSAMPGASLWLQRRYQDDFLNPTSGATRRLKDAFIRADLTADGRPIGDGLSAALGYIHSDLNQWPGWHHGWGPGNPNFHTDKYMVAVYAGAAMLDHPHARDWLDFGRDNFLADVSKVFLPPDGVGYECPGYSGYSAGLQLGLASVFLHTGYGNLVADRQNPRVAPFVELWKGNGRWHRNLLTPPDIRLGLRHEAPIGDTHRWTSGLGEGFGKLAKFFKDADPAFAAEMMAAYHLLRDQQPGKFGEGLVDELIQTDPTIQPAPLESLDWRGGAYRGFGAIMRTRFGKPDETFLTFKAGAARGHYHNDDLSYHYYGAGLPLSLDYNCSYHPRGDHAALHNSMTFGRSQPFLHAGASREAEAVPAMEQLTDSARVGAFVSTEDADLCVAERSGSTLVLSPIDPRDARFQYAYPARRVRPFTHRRFIALIKHDPSSPLADYLVVRDETDTDQPQQLNIHLLVRSLTDAQADGGGWLIRGPGQWSVDALLFLAHARQPRFEVGRWWYMDEYMMGPNQWPRRDGKKPLAEDEAQQKAWHDKIRQTDGQALIPPEGWNDRWLVGEYQRWLKVSTAPGSAITWVLYPARQGATAPRLESINAPGDAGESMPGVRVTLGGSSEQVWMSTTAHPELGHAAVRRDGQTNVLIRAGDLPPLGRIRDTGAGALGGRVIDDAEPQR